MNSKGKYIILVLNKFYKKKKVVMEFISLYIPEQNSIAKWFQYIFNIMKNAMLVDSKLSKEFWTEIIATAAYLKNFLPTSFKKRQ